LPIFDHEKLSNQKNLIKMLENFQQLGFVIISNISKAEGTVTKFAESLGPVRTTNFGKHFDVVSKPDPNDLAYTSLGLTAHTDNPYRKPIPGIQILHCIANEAKGGDSCLVDGFAIAEHLRETDKEAFEILTQTDVLFKFTDKDILLENYGKLIELDDFGNYVQSRFSGRLDFVTYLEPKKLEKFYSARRKIFNLYASKEFEINLEVTWSLIHQNQSIIENSEYKEVADYSFDRNQILGKENESKFIKESLAEQVVDKILLRINEVL